MSAHGPGRIGLAALRGLVDVIDDGLIVLVAARRAVTAAIAAVKSRGGLAASDPARERYVRRRAQALAARLQVPATSARNIIDAVIADARRQQHLACNADTGASERSAAARAPSD
ncbi:MAG: hypothetical protein AMXMBFR59_22070 [Rhodanobacteraceae bacterium]